MKNSISTFLFLLISFSVFGQIEWVGNHDFSESATDLVRTSQGQYILVHGKGSGITVFDKDGNIVFERLLNIFQNDYFEQISEIVELSDSSIVFSSSVVDCDVFISNFYKYDKAWNEVSAFYLYDATGPAARFSDDAVVFSEKAFNHLVKVDKFNTVQWETNLSLDNLTDLVVTADDTLWVATEQGLVKLTAAGVVVEAFPTLIFDRLEILHNGIFLAQANDMLYSYDQDFNQLAFFQLQGDAIVDLAIGQNEIAVLTSANKVLRLDLGLNQIGTTVLTGHNQSFTSVTFANNGFMVGGGEQYGKADHQNQSAFIKAVALDGSTANTAQDAALTNVQITGQPIQVINWSGIYYQAIVPSLQVTVENKGNSTINRLNVNFHHNSTVFLWECAELQDFSKSFENLDLQPGATKVLDWGEQSLLFSEDPAGTPLDLCFWTSLPNHHLETNNDNDVSCTQLLVAAREPFPIEFQAAFNPATDAVYLHFQPDIDPEKTTLSVFNTAGQLVFSQKMMPDTPLDFSQLTDGVYLLRGSFGDRVGWAKVVKY